MAIGDKYELTLAGSLYGVTTANVLNYEETNVTTDDFPALALCDAFVEDVLPSMLDCLSTSFTVHCLAAKLIAAGPAVESVKTLSTANTGDISGESLPANRVVCISLYSETYSKRGRGRHYFCGIPISVEDDNAINAANFDLFELFAQKLIDPVTESDGGQWKPVIRSKAANAYYEVVSKAVGPQIRILSGRTPRLCG